MEKVREYMKDPKIVGIAALIIGIMIGWFVIGWGIWTVEWTDADLMHLRSDVQLRSMKQIVDAYAMNGDAEDALSSWAGFGDTAMEVYAEVKKSGEVPAENLAYFEQLLTAQGMVFPAGLTENAEVVAEEVPAETAEEVPAAPIDEPEAPVKRKITSILGILLGVFLVLFLIGGAAIVYFFFIKNNNKPQAPARQRSVNQGPTTQRQTVPAEGDDFEADETEEIVAYDYDNAPKGSSSGQHLRQFVTEYVFGNDLYDDTFSIDASSGEFLGECGVGISDTIGNVEPKNVTAFEVWLFDKNDVQTVTKVLMSEFAMNNPGILQRLEVKGEPVQIRPDTVVELETATLKLEARILDVTYGRGGQAENSFVQQMQVELTVMSRESLG